MPWSIPPEETRSRISLQRHFEIESRLAERLRQAPSQERRGLYSEIYDEFFRRLGDELPRAADDPAGQAQTVALQAQALAPFFDATTEFLEVGSGDGALALHLAGQVRRVIAVDASREAFGDLDVPENFSFVLGDGLPLELPDTIVDLAYSCHFLEHLHPEDARLHLAEMRRVLRPGGHYVCITPNRVWGPHDISRYFADAPRGFHLHEYTHGELVSLLRGAGFQRVASLRGVGEPPRVVSARRQALVETLLLALPSAWRRLVLTRFLAPRGRPPFRPLEQVKVVAEA